MFSVSAEPVTAFVDAFTAALVTDAAYAALVTGTYGHVTEAAAATFPYVVIGTRSVNGDAGAMQVAGSRVSLQLDGWSDTKGPYTVQLIGSRIAAVMERRRGFSVPGFAVVDGSLHREMSEYLSEFDAERPQHSLYRLVQRWTVEIHES